MTREPFQKEQEAPDEPLSLRYNKLGRLARTFAPPAMRITRLRSAEGA